MWRKINTYISIWIRYTLLNPFLDSHRKVPMRELAGVICIRYPSMDLYWGINRAGLSLTCDVIFERLDREIFIVYSKAARAM